MKAPTVLITSTGNIPRTFVACLASAFDTTVGFAVVSMATQPLLFCPLVGKRHAVEIGPIYGKGSPALGSYCEYLTLKRGG